MAKMGIREDGADPRVAALEMFRHMDAEEKGFVTKEDYTRLATTNPDLLKRVGEFARSARWPARAHRVTRSVDASAKQYCKQKNHSSAAPGDRPERLDARDL